jgi:hypothetical protein
MTLIIQITFGVLGGYLLIRLVEYWRTQRVRAYVREALKYCYDAIAAIRYGILALVIIAVLIGLPLVINRPVHELNEYTYVGY